MLKNLFFLFVLILITACTKSHDLTLTICDMGTSCKNCYEVVKVSYLVDEYKKQVTVSGKSIEGKDFKEVNEKCKVTDVNNWICDSAFMTTQANSGVLTIINKPNSSLASSGKESCLIK